LHYIFHRGFDMAVARETIPPPGSEAGIPGNAAVVQTAEIRAVLKAAEARGLLGAKDRQMGGRFPSALVDAAQRASGIIEPTDLLTYALVRVAFEDNYGEKLLSLEGSVPRGTFFED
jgi:predicted alpha/beta-hydrolase family hydrolase